MDGTTDRDLKEREEKGAEKEREGGRTFVAGQSVEERNRER